MRFQFDSGTIEVNMPSEERLRDAVRARLRERRGFALATLNLDHLAKLARDARFAAAYGAQDYVTADGWPIVALSRIAGRPVELAPGSDLILPLCRDAAALGIPVALVGSHDQALTDAAAALRAAVPDLAIARTIAPSQRFDPEGPEADRILGALEAAGVGLCFVALGAPKQEILAARARSIVPDIGFACIGAGLDFLGGHQVRAPKLLRRIRLEWLWRALCAPRRMIPRYVRAALVLPGQGWRAWRLRRTGVR